MYMCDVFYVFLFLFSFIFLFFHSFFSFYFFFFWSSSFCVYLLFISNYKRSEKFFLFTI